MKRFKSSGIGLAIALAMGSSMMLVAPAVQAQQAALDGRVFEGVFLQRGKTRGDADTISFRSGRLHSSACDQYGYGDGSYVATPEGDTVRFEAQTESPKYGKLEWRGVIRAEKLDATVMMVQSGKTPIENWVVAGQKK